VLPDVFQRQKFHLPTVADLAVFTDGQAFWVNVHKKPFDQETRFLASDPAVMSSKTLLETPSDDAICNSFLFNGSFFQKIARSSLSEKLDEGLFRGSDGGNLPWEP